MEYVAVLTLVNLAYCYARKRPFLTQVQTSYNVTENDKIVCDSSSNNSI